MLDAFMRSVHRTVLPNGVTVLAREQRGSGVVAINTWVKAGYFHEADDVAGMAHLIEHMFFKGSKRFPGAEQIMLEVASLGGESNAGTIYDTTNYYFVLPTEAFRRGLEIQADAIMNPLFDPVELAKEAEVVIEESNRKLDNASAVALERMFATAFTQHRMKRWRIGSNEVLRSIERENLLAFFEALYRPENLILVITGDVSPGDALAAAEQTFGEIPRGRMTKEHGPVEPPQNAFRFGQSSADIRTSYSVYGWHTPGANHPDELVLNVVAAILGEGRSSRLFRYAVAPVAAGEVTAFNSTFEDAGIFAIRASFDEPNRAETDRRVLVEVERMRRSRPTVWELQRAKNALEAQMLFALETALGQAGTLGQYESRGSYLDIARDLERLAEITPEHVSAAARDYLTVDNLTLYHYRPNGTEALTQEQALDSVRAAFQHEPATEPDLSIPPKPAPVQQARSRRSMEVFTLANGATLVVRENPGAPIVSAGVYVPGGRVDENSANAGITRLMAQSLRRGTRKRSGEQIDRDSEFLGSSIGVAVADDYFGLTMNLPARSIRPGLELLADVLLHPTFPEEGVARERDLQRAAIRRSYDSGVQRPFQLLAQALYGAHPYALPADGVPASLEALDREALETWWSSHIAATGALVVIAGDVAAEDARTLVEESLASLPAARVQRSPAAAPVPPASPIEIIESRDRRQTAITVAFPTVPASHPDVATLRVLEELTSGLTGTFGIELRAKRSLAYTVLTRVQSRRQAGAFVAYMASEARKEPEANEGLAGEFRRLLEDGITEPDVTRAKALLVGSTRIGLQGNASQAADIAQGFFVGSGIDATERMLEAVPSIRVDELREVAKRYFSTGNTAMGILRGR